MVYVYPFEFPDREDTIDPLVGRFAHMAIIDPYRHVFPIIGGEKAKDGQILLAEEVYGTAFSIGGKYWVTAGHVLRSAAKHSSMALGFVSKKQWLTRAIGSYEILESHDVGIFEVENIEVETLCWLGGELPMGVQVFATGFPYALRRDLPSIALRSFRGHIVSTATTTVLPGRPRVYELDFQCPRGLSGAPLVFENQSLLVAGLVVGNAATQMLVLSDREVLVDGQTTVVERYEMLQLGIAVQSDAVGPLRSKILGSTLQEYLASRDLVQQQTV